MKFNKISQKVSDTIRRVSLIKMLGVLKTKPIILIYEAQKESKLFCVKLIHTPC